MRTSKPLKPERRMTLKERRAQVDAMRAPKEPGAVISLPGRKVLRSSKPAPQAKLQSGVAGSRVGAAAIGPPTKLRAAPHSWFGFDVEWGNYKFDTPVGTKSLNYALHRASDNKLIKQWCQSDPDGSYDWDGKTLNWGIADPTILTESVEYYVKIAASADRGTRTDVNGWGCATGWSAAVRGPNIPALGRPAHLPSGETYGCVCEDTTGRAPVQGYLGDPVNTATGALNESAVDGAVPAPGVSFALRRTYASDNNAAGMLGRGWSSAYDTRLVVTDSKVTYVADNGSRVVYTKESATGGYTASSAGVTATLSGSAADGFTLTTAKKGKLTFNGGGKLTSWKDRAGVGLSFTYADGNLSSITDGVGHTINVTVDPASKLLTGVDLPGGRNVTYGYTSGQLTSVKTESGTVTYGYEEGWLSSITDAAGKVVMRTSYSGSGLVREQTDAEGKVTKYTRGTLETNFQDGNGGIWTDLYHGSMLRNRIDPLGNVTTFTYDANRRLKDSVDARGNHTAMTYDARGNLKTRSEGPLTQAWTYNTNNTIKTYTDGRGATTTYDYDAEQRLKEENGPSGKQTYTYDDRGNIKTVTSPRGKVTRYDYDTKSNLESETSPSGAKTTYTYDPAGRQLTTTDPRGNVEGADPAKYTTTNTYNAAGLLETVTDPAGHVTTYGYDDNGNQKKITDAAGRVTEYEYDNFNRVTKAITPGGVTLTAYDAVGNVEAVTDPSGAKTTYGYDPANRLASMTSPRGNVQGTDPAKYTTTYGYDENGNLTKTVDPTGATTTTEYDALNRPTLVTDPLKGVTETKYDANGNVIQIIDPLKKSTFFTYKSSDLLETVKNPLGKITQYGYDADGNRSSSTSPLGHKQTWTYNADGQLETQVDARGNEQGTDPAKFTTSYKYDGAGNLKQVTNPLGHTQKFEYDALGQQRVATNQNGEATKTDYDALGRVETVTAPDGGVTTYTYTAAGNIKTRTDDNKHTTTYGYDDNGRLKSVTDPLGRQTGFGYDPDGNRDTVTNARGITSTTLHDPLGRPVSTTYSDDTPDVTVTYDGLGNRKKVVDGSGTRTFTYDPLNRLKTASVPGQAKGFVYDYNDGGQLTSRTLPHGRATTYTYDDDGNRQTAKTGADTTTYGYDPAGRLISTKLPGSNGYTETRTFDATGQPAKIASSRGSTTLSSWHAVLDPAGRPKRIDSQRKSKAESLYYTYDSAGRMKSECVSPTQADTCPTAAATTTYDYDRVGNRQTRTTPKGTTTYTYDEADQLTKATTGTAATEYSYDKDGNQTAAGTRTYTYDADNRLTAMTAGGKTWGFAYDADGNRTQRTKTGVTLAWDINNTLPQLAAEYTAAGTPYADYQYTPTEEIESQHRTVSGTATAYYYHRDLVGSITDLTTATGTPAKTYDYSSAFGTGGPGTDANQPGNNFGYAGQYKEPVGGENADLADALGYNMRARTYDPGQGRFTGRDPYTPGQQTPAESPYTYTENRPTYLYDPAGTCSWTSFGGDKSCWTKDIPGTEWIPLSPALDKIGDSVADTCEDGANYAKGNGRSGWSGCVDEFTGVGPIRRGVDSYQQGNIADGTAQCLGGIGQFGLIFLPGPRVPTSGLGVVPKNGIPKIVPGEGTVAVPGTGVVRLPDFNSTLSANRHYSAHVLGVKINKKGRVTGPTLEPANMPEFRGAQGRARYRSAARTFMSGNGPSGSITMPGDTPGSFFRVDPRTGYFGYMNSGGTISTFFRPHKNPVQYFWEQFK
ncbi:MULTISPECIES: DUF6531 domain-containing protein [unclassified Streptomyces]|uniref:DUF6531 domain-containing protein n=1 Tax=unclassified Streptomyces TaxID=2593676 RepID=UPI00136D1EC3|nr:RHS repeat protein [Streptomyces sp. SID335]MYZ13285.1 RHS repeat protein [Streptomyces sp. SID337]NEA02242.1 RHS repeat protein [Streptomyces sp. SID10116]NEB49964.1 RHS repeat protein [Streptomyces sp. SID339]